MSTKNKKTGKATFKPGQKVLLDAVVKSVKGDQVTVTLDIVTTAKDLLKFDQSTTNILD